MAYRGKYPRRIQSVWKGALRDFNQPQLGHVYFARTNDGTLFIIDNAHQPIGKGLPQVGRDVALFPQCIEQDRS